ncbi:CPBP family intramembrane glutamic endopeptidase [Paenibacillus sp. NPDC058177]|uniref:CPBP family intramembrane glutamic endopeptidase n=1 Tax=Paenibacillus sp. NPDC058177 TaxID=3346369 RepID=UPI0036DDD954
MFEVLMYLCSFILIPLNRRILGNCRGSVTRDLIRVFGADLPFILPIFYYEVTKKTFSFSVSPFYYLLSIGAAIICLTIQFDKFKPFLQKDIYYILPPMSLRYFIIMQYTYFSSAILEEFFYRALFPNLGSYWLEATLSGVLFCIAHYIQPETRARYNIRSYLIIFGLSLIWYASYYYSHSIIPVMLGHLVYNSLGSYSSLIRYRVSKEFGN